MCGDSTDKDSVEKLLDGQKDDSDPNVIMKDAE